MGVRRGAQQRVGRRTRRDIEEGPELVSERTSRVWFLPFLIVASAYLLLTIGDRVFPLEGSRETLERYGDARGAVLVGLVAGLTSGGDQTRAYLVPRRLLS